ncbi:MAG: hypothetical protein O3A00_29280 [Planctomycetota bacterium]|nr:hypothetical protein [Planctomycetota bacterium]
MAVVGVAGAWTWARHELSQQRRIVEDLEQQGRPIADLQAENCELQLHLDEIDGRQSLLSALDQSHHPVRLLGLATKCSRMETGRIQIQRLKFTRESPPQNDRPTTANNSSVPKDATAQASRFDRMALELDGLADGDVTITQFILALRRTNVFRRVELKSTSEHKSDAQRFDIHCVF